MDICSICKNEIEESKYAKDNKDNKICYSCCAEEDKKYMVEHGKNTLYLIEENGKLKIQTINQVLEICVG